MQSYSSIFVTPAIKHTIIFTVGCDHWNAKGQLAFIWITYMLWSCARPLHEDIWASWHLQSCGWMLPGLLWYNDICKVKHSAVVFFYLPFYGIWPPNFNTCISYLCIYVVLALCFGSLSCGCMMNWQAECFCRLLNSFCCYSHKLHHQ